MSYIQRFDVALTTDASGNAQGYTPAFTGKILAVHWVKPGSGGITSATVAITSEATGETILSVSSLNASTSYYPRGPIHTTAGVAQLYAAAGLPVTDQIGLANDRVSIAVSSGGNTLSATCRIVVG